jgi:hypothetical protein
MIDKISGRPISRIAIEDAKELSNLLRANE